MKDIDDDLTNQEHVWFLFEEFNSGLEEMAKEEWIFFRGKIHKFESFLGEWVDKIQSSETDKRTTVVTVCLLQEISLYKDILPVLKYCRGDVFSNQHWSELFALLGMPNVPIENLTFRDFLNVKEAVAINAEALKDLNNRAQGEIIVREALTELDMWGAKTKFALTDHEDSNGNKLMLIKGK